MDSERIIRSLRLQLLIERTVIGAVLLSLLATWSIGRIRQGKSVIVVDGKPVVCVPSQRVAEDVLDSLKTKAGGNSSEVEFKQEVCVARAPRDARPVSRYRAVRVLQNTVSPVVARWSIIVNGKPVVGVPDQKTAGEALEMAKMKFGSMVNNLAEEPQFKERVTVDVAAIEPSAYCKTAEEAVKKLFSGTRSEGSSSVYTVKSGDVASSIASRMGVSLDDMKALNPGRDLDRLQIDDKINIGKSRIMGPQLTVVVRDQSERIERIPAPIQQVSSARIYTGKMAELAPGKSGERKVKMATIYENGQKTGSEILEEEILREPIPRRIAVGIKPR